MKNPPSEQLTLRKNLGMNLSDIAMLLGFIGIYDLRVQVDELKVRAWAESLDKDIPLDEAKKIVSAHYANSDAAVNPSHINRGWRVRLLAEKERQRSEAVSKELQRAIDKAAPPEVAEKYLKEIRSVLNRGKSEMEVNSGEVASNE
jgi:DNA-binding transcriptional MerR regulator